ncbi:uncharacterized protein Z520_03930 [Fonsecaea multimorphosa CBS 102226]|uniref:BZIP domain-containing protein n=1 Tax=Fonsecaea multimorphosa CBS 102226 TaxID=1442371 RepID=A0A0D2KAR6_9EURO|nr:uncharacterized protein Z520_03930 [Fonsecaea multimorphosa CBS 102226]KIY00245.1 hypothetical protein Z520_03930 [Fonsecaea multimorphosa CBS 102226]OAL27081.1 hypothetical protein AYO22_03712 [Fonsecaea multimorphosa]
MSDIFRPFFRSVEDKVANRREQLRKAQKTFRERRDQYLRVLEKSVRRLQATEAKLQNEVDQLERDLAATKSKLAQCEAELRKSTPLTHYNYAYSNKSGYVPGSGEFNLAPEIGGAEKPAYLSPPYSCAESGAGASVSGTSSCSTLVWIETMNGQPVQMHVQQTQDFGFLPPNGSKNAYAGALSPASASLGPDRSATTILVAQLDAVAVAMEFVLKLESPCLPHLQKSEEEENNPSTSSSSSPHGHVHTASAALLCCYPSPSSSSTVSPPTSTSYADTKINTSHASPLSPPATSSSSPSFSPLTWPAPKATLERLLEISDNLPIDRPSELTPVQAWHCVRQSPSFTSMNVQGLNRMAERLVAHVKCYG